MATVFYFPGMFLNHIGDSIKLPEDVENYNAADYPHWHVFLNLHLGNKINISDLKNNAEVIASFNNKEIMNVTLNDLMDRGLAVETNNYIV